MMRLNIPNLQDELNDSNSIILSLFDSSVVIPESIPYIKGLIEKSINTMNNLIKSHDTLNINLNELNKNLDDVVSYISELSSVQIPEIEEALILILEQANEIVESFGEASDKYNNAVFNQLENIKSDIQILADYTGIMFSHLN